METIVFLDRGTIPAQLRKPSFPHVWLDHDRTAPEEVIDRLRGATIAVTNKVKLREADLSELPGLKFIAVAATGVDCVDTGWCRDHKIVVSNVPGYTGSSVPEHVFMLLLALRRNLVNYRTAIKEGRWKTAPFFAMLDYPVQDIAGSTLGLIGYGKLAKEVEKRALAFGMKVLIAERKDVLSVRPGRTSFIEVLRNSDVISLHAPLSPPTRHVIAAPELALMKKSAILINTARGGLVDEGALAEALKSGRLEGAGVDVLTQEPPKDGNPLLDLKLPNLIVTPHIAWTSRQALEILSEEVMKNIEAFAAGETEERGVMKPKVMRITQLGEPVLRKVSKPLPLPLSKAQDRLIDDMIATMKKARGVGIAAPQVDVGQRLFIVAPEPSVRYPKSPQMAPVAMINPVLVKHSKKVVTDWEGCLSIPGLRGRVPRYHSIEIEFTARDGRRLVGKLSGFVARIFQHEFDHINGMVYVDRVKDTRTFMTESEYHKMMTRS